MEACLATAYVPRSNEKVAVYLANHTGECAQTEMTQSQIMDKWTICLVLDMSNKTMVQIIKKSFQPCKMIYHIGRTPCAW